MPGSWENADFQSKIAFYFSDFIYLRVCLKWEYVGQAWTATAVPG